MMALIQVLEDEELQALARTRDEWALREKADAMYELDVTDCDDVVGTYQDGLEAGLTLANLVLSATGDAPFIFKICLDQYDDNDVVTYWVGSRDQVRARLEAIAPDPRHET